MLLGFSLTQHCNLRCPHCIRDDVVTVRSIDAGLVERTLDDAVPLFGQVLVSFTGGEPTLHPEWERITRACAARGIPYRFISNGWHMKRLLPALERYPPVHVRLSLSGATEAVHDGERGRGSFRRVLLAVALLSSRRIPTSLSIVIDRRDRHQLREAADLAEALGCVEIHFILPQPVPGSVERGSDLSPGEWWPVRDEVHGLAREDRLTRVILDYGAPFDGAESLCDTLLVERVYVDAHGRLSICCQLSEYGFNERDVVADLNERPLAEAWPLYLARIEALKRASAPPARPAGLLDALPCMRCAKSCGKLDWLADHTGHEWALAAGAMAAGAAAPVPPRLVRLRPVPAGR
jgi:MoaA/NifB/PqqE/SkfB family radical SAM enzyme